MAWLTKTREKMLGNLIKLLFASKLFIVAKESIKELKGDTVFAFQGKDSEMQIMYFCETILF